MPEVDESAEERQTYGNAPGWSGRMKAVTPDSAPPTDAPVASSTTDAEAAPSAEPVPSESQPSEQGTPPSTQPESQKPFNMPPQERWDAILREREEAKQQAKEARELAQLALQKLQTPQQPSQPESDPYAGMDAPTAEFYRHLDKRIEVKATLLAEQKVQGVLQSLDAGRRELAEIKISQFRRDNPEIRPDSVEERAIAGYVQSGFDLNSAKKLALYDKLESENRALKSKTALLPTKRLANTDASAGIPTTAGLPPKPGDWRERVGDILDKGGSMTDAANLLFGKKR